MNRFLSSFFFVLLFNLSLLNPLRLAGQTPYYDKSKEGFLVFHPIHTDASGKIISWRDQEPGKAFDFVLHAVWSFWDTMRTDLNGLPYYMNHQVWRPGINDRRGIGGDQLAMALSSWALWYAYTGNEKVKENMKFIADYYLSHSLSPTAALWPNLPYPYNTLIYSGVYDGDMVIGKDYTQPDKAGSFGDELVTLYKMTGNNRYLQAATDIATTLARQTGVGDQDRSPLPFKVNAVTGEIGKLITDRGTHKDTSASSYTTNWVGTLQLFDQLIQLNAGEAALYQNARNRILTWMRDYPLRTNKWGPFFEDIGGWSDTQINAVTFSRYMMLNPQRFPQWRQQVRDIFAWVYKALGNDSWQRFGVRVVNEQTAYQTPGNSHTSRQAAAELLYAALTNERASADNAIRQLLWATYMVDADGKNCYPRDEVWLTDGYGDYMRHFMRAMAAQPSLAPSDANHILHSSSVICQADYYPDFNKTLHPDVHSEEMQNTLIYYQTFDQVSTETLRLQTRPSMVTVDERTKLAHVDRLQDEGWTWQALASGGIMTIKHSSGNRIKIFR
jgi:hypothetical protein